jgi:ribosomal-protein-alanine acetyltransferase
MRQQSRLWRVLDGRPFVPGRRRVALLSPYFPHPPAHEGAVRTLHLVREAAREFDVVLFAFTDGADEQYEPVLEFCSRVVLVERPGGDPRRGAFEPRAAAEHRSATMQELWDRMPREIQVEARQVQHAQMAAYGGDILTVFEGEWSGWLWQRYERWMAKRYRRVLVMSAADPDWEQMGQLERGVLHEIMDRPPAIRAARKEDVAELDRLQRSSPEAVLWEPSNYLAYDCRVAEASGRIAGFVVCRKLAADESEILSLVVDPDLRRRGVASALMRTVLDDRTGATWYLEVRESNWRARNLYKKLGFVDVSLRPAYYQDTGEGAVVMRMKPC